MTSNFDFTEKAEQTLQTSFQLAKDYANAQGMFCPIFLENQESSLTRVPVHPAHIASAFLNEGGGASLSMPGSLHEGRGNGSVPLFVSCISKAGGEPVCLDVL